VQGPVGVGVGHRQVVLHNACDIEKGLGVWTKTAFLLSISQLVAFFSKHGIFFGQRPLVPLLLLGPPFFPIILFGSTTTLLTRMTSSSLRMQWPLTSQSHGSVSQREQLDFFVTHQTPHPKGWYLKILKNTL
jgi:hypothetical protein